MSVSARRLAALVHFTCIFLTVVLIGIAVQPAYAQEPIAVDGSDSILQAGGWNQPAPEPNGLQTQDALDRDGLYTAIANAIEGWDGVSESVKVDVSAFGVTESNQRAAFTGFLNSRGEYFYIDNSWSYWASGTAVTAFTIYFDTSHTPAQIQAFKTRAHAIASQVEANWSDEQKVLFLHDYLVTHCQYDLTYSKYNAYNALVEGSAVCQGYAEAYEYLLRLAGITCDVISSDALNHAWNLVTVGGKQYYVDCTWDDPTGLHRPSYAGHENLLRSRKGITDTEHTSTDWIDTTGSNVYTAAIGASSTKYDSYYWSECETLIPHIGNLWAYTTTNGVSVHDYATGSDTQLVSSIGSWPVLGSQYSSWNGNFSSLASTGSAFVYTDARNVYTITPSGTKTTKYTLSSSQQAKGYIYSLLYNEDTGNFDCSWHESPSSEAAGTVSLDLAAHVESVVVLPARASGEIGATVQLAASVTPANALNHEIFWTSSDESVATVDADGLVSLLKQGQATITAHSRDHGKTGTATITVTGHQIEKAEISLEDAEGLVYNAMPHEPAVVATWHGNPLVEGQDYTVSYSDNTAAGTATATITGAGDFEGSVSRAFNIAQLDLSDESNLSTAAIWTQNMVYDGTPKTVGVAIAWKAGIDIPESDYTVEYENNINAGIASARIVPASNNLTGMAPVVSFEIAPAPLDSVASGSSIIFAARVENVTYNGEERIPDSVIIKGLTKDVDYTVSFSNNVNAGQGTITFNGIGNYTGDVTSTFTIYPADISMDMVGYEQREFTYTGTPIEPTPTVTFNGKTLTLGADYIVSHQDNTDAGVQRATVTVAGTGNFRGSDTTYFDIKPRGIEDARITLEPAEFLYDGQGHNPAVSVKIDGIGTLTPNDYDISYDADGGIGEHTVTITGKGNFTGMAQARYAITDTKTVTDADGVAFTYKVADGKVTITNIQANGATEIVVPETLEGNPGFQTFAVGSITKDALEGNGQVTSLIVKSAATELEEGALEGISPNASVLAPEGSAAASAAAKHDEEVAEAAAAEIKEMLPSPDDLETADVLTDANMQAVANARTTYEALSEQQQGTAAAKEVLAAIEAAEGKLRALQEEADAEAKKAESQAAAKPVIELIAALPTTITSDEDAAAAKAAKEAYDALTDDQKAEVDPKIAAQLESAIEAAEIYEASTISSSSSTGGSSPSSEGDSSSASSPSPSSSSTEYPASGSADDSKADSPNGSAGEPAGDSPASTAGSSAKKPLAKGTTIVAGSGTSKARYKVMAVASAKAAGQVAYTKPQAGKAKSVSIPATVKIGGFTYKVTSIAAGAFKGNTAITGVSIGKNVKAIPKSAFQNCKKLTKVTGGANVVTIGNSAFAGCTALKSFTVGANATKISAKAFQNCKKLAKLTIKSKKVKSIGKQAFKGTGAKMKVKAPKAKKKAYKKMLLKAGMSKKGMVK